MAGRQRVSQVALQMVVPIVLERKTKHAQMEEDLKNIGCKGLLA